MEIIMNQFDNYELTTIDYTLKYYLEHNEMLDDEDIEWCNIVRKKIDTIIQLQAKYDMELTALITHLEVQNEIMCESRLNCSNPSETPDREEVLLNMVYEKAFTMGWDKHINPKVDFDLIKNQDRIYKYK